MSEQRHVSKGLNPCRGPEVHCHRLLHWLPRCRHMWSAATVIFCYWNRRRLLSVTHRLDYPRRFTGIMTENANVLFISTEVLSSGGTRTPSQSPPGRPVNSSPPGERNASCETFMQRSFKSLWIKVVGRRNERVSFLFLNNRNYRVFVNKSLLSCFGCILNLKYL